MFACDKTTSLPASLETIELCDPGLRYYLRYYRAPNFLPADITLKARVLIEDNIIKYDLLDVLLRIRFWHRRAMLQPTTLQMDVHLKITKPRNIADWFELLKFTECVHRLHVEKTDVCSSQVEAIFTYMPNLRELYMVGSIGTATVNMVRAVRKALPHCSLPSRCAQDVHSPQEQDGGALRAGVRRREALGSQRAPSPLRRIYSLWDGVILHKGGAKWCDLGF